MIVITIARKPLEDAYVRHCPIWGTGLVNIDASRIPIRADDPEPNTSRRRGDQNTATTYNDHGWKGAGQWSEGSPLGRWPTNLILCPEAAQGLDDQSGILHARGNVTPTKRDNSGGVMRANGNTTWGLGPPGPVNPGDAGGASRFFKVLAGDPLRP